MASGKTRIALPTGDPAGIGAEICLKAALDPQVCAACDPIVICDPNVLARHDRHAAATRAAVQTWGQAGAIELQCQEPADYSSSLTAVRLTEGYSADGLRGLILRTFNMSLGNGLGILKDRVFRIGHLGDFNDLSLIGALGGIEMGLALAAIPHAPGGVDAAMASLTASNAA